MRKTSPYLILFGLLLTLLLGCGGPKGMALTLDGEEIAVKDTTSVAVVRPDLRQLQILVANYKVDLSNNIMGAPAPKNPGEVKVAFYIKGDGKEFKKPVEPGEYTGEKINSAYAHRGGESNSIGFYTSGKPIDGKVVIKSIENETVTGTVDIKHEQKSIKGSFKAKIIPDR